MNTDIRIAALAAAIAQDYAGELAAHVGEDGRLIVEVKEAAKA